MLWWLLLFLLFSLWEPDCWMTCFLVVRGGAPDVVGVVVVVVVFLWEWDCWTSCLVVVVLVVV